MCKWKTSLKTFANFHIFAAAVFFSPCESVFALEPTSCFDATFSEVRSLSDFPSNTPPIVKGLLNGISDRNDLFNSGDVGMGSRERFSIATYSVNCILVAIEHGGIAHDLSLTYFVKTDSGWSKSKRLVYAGNVQPKSLGEFLIGVQSTFGTMYEVGDGVARNSKEAIKWYRKAAEQGDSSAQFSLGLKYASGEGEAVNMEEAEKWLNMAATVDPGYQVKLGMLYLDGKILAQNYTKAMKLFQRAADKGDPYAEEQIGNIFAEGKGVKKNDLEAVKWYRLSINKHSVSSASKLALMYSTGRGVPENQVIAYALISFSKGLSATNKPPFREKLSIMPADKIAMAKVLTEEIDVAFGKNLSKHGNEKIVTDLLDKYENMSQLRK